MRYPIKFVRKSLLFFAIISLYANVYAQKHYGISGGEFIISYANVERNNDQLPINPRFSIFLHLTQYTHFDFNKNFGFYTGIGLRNVGLITNEENYKAKRRSYMLGVPIALKTGKFDKDWYVYAGGEYDFLFHYKHKIFTNGKKIKYHEWFSDRTNTFLPSVFAGVQFSKGINIKFKYYLNDFLNKDFSGSEAGNAVNFSQFNKTRIFYVSFEYLINTKKIKEKTKQEKDTYVAGF